MYLFFNLCTSVPPPTLPHPCTQNAPPPVPSSHTHHAATNTPDKGSGGVAQAARGVAAMNVSDKTQHYKVKFISKWM